MNAYAIVESGGKQYRVSPGDTIDVETLPGNPGDSILLEKVLLVHDGESVTVGHPIVDGVQVMTELQEHGRGEKIIVFKYKSKVRYERKQGHRQSFTRLLVKDILNSTEKKSSERGRRKPSGS